MAKMTLKELSAELGMSASSVSEILNRKSKKYKAETVERVFDAASKHNYLPNIAASMMLNKKYNAIALVTSFPEKNAFVNDDLIRGIQAELLANDYHMIFAPVSDKKLVDEDYMPKFLKTWMVDGVLVLYWREPPKRLSDLIKKYDIPAIWINCKRKYDCVYTDEFAPMEKVTREYIESGHKRIAYADYTFGVSPNARTHFSVIDRRRGYESAMKSAGLKPERFGDSGFIHLEKRIESALKSFKSGDTPTAIIASFIDTATPIYCAALSMGIKIPDDLSIFSFTENKDSFPFKKLFIPWYDIGFRSAEALMRKINDPKCKRLDPIVIKIED